VFVIGAGVGAVIIAVSHHASAQRVILKQVAPTTPSAAATTPVRRRPTAVTTTAPHSRPASISHPAPIRTNPTYGSTTPADADASFSALESGLAGSVGLAVAPLGAGRIQAFGGLQIAHAWSTSKVPVLTTLLLDDEHTGQQLTWISGAFIRPCCVVGGVRRAGS